MKPLMLLGFVLLCGCSSQSVKHGVPEISASDLYAEPEKYDGQVVEVVGTINVQFESMTLSGSEKTKESTLGFGIWLRMDLDSIREKSPKYFTEVADGYRAAGHSGGGLIGEMRFRGHFVLSKDWCTSRNCLGGKHREGFGHFGSYGAEIIVEDVLDFRSNEEGPNPEGCVCPERIGSVNTTGAEQARGGPETKPQPTKD